jgi:hypothetical protein
MLQAFPLSSDSGLAGPLPSQLQVRESLFFNMKCAQGCERSPQRAVPIGFDRFDR